MSDASTPQPIPNQAGMREVLAEMVVNRFRSVFNDPTLTEDGVVASMKAVGKFADVMDMIRDDRVDFHDVVVMDHIIGLCNEADELLTDRRRDRPTTHGGR